MSEPNELRILLADDHHMVREGVRSIVQSQPGWTVCGEAANGRDAVLMAEQCQPDIVVLDMTMPELNGLEAAKQIKRRCPGTEILIFSGYETEELVRQVFEVGARSYILKTAPKEQLLDALRSLAQHKPYFTSHVGEIIFAKFLRTRKAGREEENQSGRLTDREREIVQLLAEGKSNKEVATTLGISVKTAETHRAAIMRKLSLESLSDLVRYAIRNHIITA